MSDWSHRVPVTSEPAEGGDEAKDAEAVFAQRVANARQLSVDARTLRAPENAPSCHELKRKQSLAAKLNRARRNSRPPRPLQVCIGRYLTCPIYYCRPAFRHVDRADSPQAR